MGTRLYHYAFFSFAHYSITVKGLSPGTDIQPLAVQIVTSCELIQPARLPEVEQLLSYLQSRKANSSLTDFDGRLYSTHGQAINANQFC